MTKLVMKTCDAFTVPSQYMYEKALELGLRHDKLMVIPWGIDRAPFQPRVEDRLATRRKYGFEPDSKIVLGPRAMGPLYNHDVVLRAFMLVARKESNLRLALIRPATETEYLRQLGATIRRTGIEDSVKWLPYQESMDELGRIYRMSDLMVSVPSSESYGFTVYESMSAGCPAIISDLPVFETSLNNDVHVLKVPVRDVNATAEAMERLLNDSVFRQQIQTNALGFEGMPTVERQAELVEELYAALAGRTPGGS
jgi:glycosyltransferase involved in cell wall biosynthesis